MAFRSLYKTTCFTLIFLLAGLGVLVATTLPAFQVPDEPVHWGITFKRMHSWQKFIGLESPDCSLVYSLPSHFETGRIAFNQEAKMVHGRFRNLRELKPSCEAPYVSYGGVLTYPGLLAASAIIPNEHKKAERAISVFYLGRILQGALWILALAWLVFLPLRAQQYRGGTFLLLSATFSPLLVQQAFGISADGITFLLSVALAGLVLYPDTLRRLEFITCMLLACIVGFTKPPLYPLVPLAACLALLSLALRLEKPLKLVIQEQRKLVRGLVGIVIFSFLCTLYGSLQDHSVPAHQILGRNLSAAQQLKFMLESPAWGLPVLHESFASRFNFESLGSNLGWLSLPLSGFTLNAFRGVFFCGLAIEFLILIISHLVHGVPRGRVLVLRLGAGGLGGLGLYACALITPLVMYLTWTEVGSTVIQGVQGRYFFPVLLLFPAFIAICVAPKSGMGFGEIKLKSGWLTGLLFACTWVAFGLLLTYVLRLFPHLYQDFMARYW